MISKEAVKNVIKEDAKNCLGVLKEIRDGGDVPIENCLYLLLAIKDLERFVKGL
jgi:phosphate uptake regulator